MSIDQITVRKQDGVGWMTFNNPARHNALTAAMWIGICDALTDFEADPRVRVCVMTGAGEKAFVSGADISELGAAPGAATVGQGRPAGARAFEALGAFKKPLIAMIRGWCLGGGAAIAMKADLRIASDDSRFGIPAARLGVGYPIDSMRDLVALVGPSAAKMILFSAERMDAASAHRLGLIDEVTTPEALESRVRQLAARIGENAPLTIRAAKAAIDHIARGTDDEAHVLALARACHESADFREGRAAFLEKRTPAFEGR